MPRTSPSGRLSRSSGTGRFDSASGTGRFERETARYGTLSAGKPELAGPWNAQAMIEVFGRLEHVKAVAYILVSDGLSEKCVFFPVGGLRLTSLGARKGTTLVDAIRRHPRFDATLAQELEEARRGLAASSAEPDAARMTLGESLSGELREIGKECARAIVFDELVDMITWSGAEFEYRESNPPPAIFDAELEAVKLSLGVKQLLAEVADRVKDWRQVRDKIGNPGQSRVRALGQPPRGDAGASAIVAAAKMDPEAGCTVDDAIRAARATGVDAVAAAHAIVDLKQKNLVALETRPRLSDAARSRQVRGRIDAIESAIEQLINQLAARRKLAEQYEAIGDKEKAVENYRFVGESLQERDDVEGAIDVYNRVLDMEPMAFFAREQVGKLFERLKRTPDAVREWLKLARQYAKFNMFNRARDRLTRALRLDPQNVDLRRYLIDVLLAGGQNKEAAKQYQELAKIAESEGNHQEALACYQQIAELQPENEEIQKRLQAAVRRGPLYFLPYLVLAASFLALVAGTWWVYTRYEALTAFELARTQAVSLAKDKQFTEAKRVIDEFVAAHTFDETKVDQVRAAVLALEEYEAREHFLAAQELEESGKVLEARDAYKKVRIHFPETTWGGPEHAGKRLAKINQMIDLSETMAEAVEELADKGKFAEAFAKGRELLSTYPWSKAAQGLVLPLRIETVPPDAAVEVIVKDKVDRLQRRTPTDARRKVIQPFRLRLSLGGYERITLAVDLQQGKVSVVEGQVHLPEELRSPLRVVLPKQLRWSKVTLGPLLAAPSVDNGDVILASSDQRVYRVDARGRVTWRAPVSSDGAREDRLQLFSGIDSPPVRAGGRVVVAEANGTVRALDLETGKLAWDHPKQPIKGRGLITVGSLGRDGPVVVATRKQVIALDPKTGADAWKVRVDLPGVLVGRPRIDARTHTILGLTSAGQMVVISGKSGKLFAPIPVGGRPVGAPVPAPAGCLVATENKRLVYLWNKVKWSKQLPDAARASPLYANEVVYVPCGKTLLALRLKDGKQLWSKAFDAPLTTPAYGGNRLYAGLQDGRVYALVPDKGDVRWVFATRDELRASLRVDEGTVFVASTDFTLYAIKDDD